MSVTLSSNFYLYGLSAAISCFHPVGEGPRAFYQGGNIPRIQLASEAKAQDPGAVPPDHCLTAEHSAVQDNFRSNGQA